MSCVSLRTIKPPPYLCICHKYCTMYALFLFNKCSTHNFYYTFLNVSNVCIIKTLTLNNPILFIKCKSSLRTTISHNVVWPHLLLSPLLYNSLIVPFTSCLCLSCYYRRKTQRDRSRCLYMVWVPIMGDVNKNIVS